MGRRAARVGALTLPAPRFERNDLSRAIVNDPVAPHVGAALANAPPGSAFVLDPGGRRDPAVTVWTAWEGDALLGMGAFRQRDASHGDLKSMRTAPAHLRRGAGAAMLAHLVAEEHTRDYRGLSLETGASERYAPTRALYECAGFAACAPFADYTETAFNRFHTREPGL